MFGICSSKEKVIDVHGKHSGAFCGNFSSFLFSSLLVIELCAFPGTRDGTQGLHLEPQPRPTLFFNFSDSVAKLSHCLAWVRTCAPPTSGVKLMRADSGQSLAPASSGHLATSVRQQRLFETAAR